MHNFTPLVLVPLKKSRSFNSPFALGRFSAIVRIVFGCSKVGKVQRFFHSPDGTSMTALLLEPGQKPELWSVECDGSIEAGNAFRRQKVSFRRENSVSGRYFISFLWFLRYFSLSWRVRLLWLMTGGWWWANGGISPHSPRMFCVNTGV